MDATILDAPASTKNRAQARDPEMHQVKKGNQWYFGMKAHIGVDAATGLVHSVATTAANVADITQVPRLLHGAETQVWGDAGYAGVARRPEHQGRRVDWQVALRPGQRRRLAGSAAAQAERRKASIRAKVEHPFLYVKRHFGYAQVRYRGWPRTGPGCVCCSGSPICCWRRAPRPPERALGAPRGGARGLSGGWAAAPAPKCRHPATLTCLAAALALWCPGCSELS